MYTLLRRTLPSEAMANKVVIRIKHKFRLRFVEWLGAFQLLMLGLILLNPAPTFDSNPSFAFMQRLMPEGAWAVLLFCFGFTRVCGLIVNGSMEGVTSGIRTIGALIGFSCFFMIAFSMLSSWLVLGNPPPTGLAMYIPACGAEIAAVVCATYDARVHRNGNRSHTT